MGIDSDKLLNLGKPVNPRLNNFRLLPFELRQALVLPTKKITVIDEPEQVRLDQLDSNQEAVATKTVISSNEILQSPIIEPDSINIDELVKANNQFETTSVDESKKELLEDKPIDKPQLSFSQMLVPLVLPGPFGTLVNVVAQQGNAPKENKKEESEAQGTGAEASLETKTEEKPKPSLWDTLSSSFYKMFEPITKPLVAIWNNQIPQQVKDLFSTEKLMSLFNTKDSNVEKQLTKKILQETTLEKQRVIETEIQKRQTVNELLAREDQRRAEQARADAATNEASRAIEAQDKLVALTDKQHKEAASLQAKNIEESPTDKLSIKESRKAKTAIASGLHLDLNKLSSTATEADLNTLITEAMIESPGAGLAYLYSMGKDLYGLSNNRMFGSNDSANMIIILANYINRASDPTIALKSIDELHKEQGRSSLYNA